MNKQWLNPEGVAPPIGSYSHVATVEVGNGVLAFISGQVAVDETGQVLPPGDLPGQADVCYRQIDGIVRSLGGTLSDVVKLTSFLTDMSELGGLADVRARYFSVPYPASTAVEVSRLARDGLLIEIEAVAAIPRARSDRS